MAASTQATDRILPTESTESLEILTPDTEEKPTDSEDVKEQPLSTKGEQMVPSDVSLDATTMGASRDVMGQPGSLEASGECNAFNPPNVYAPQAFYYGGYESTSGEWDEYPQYVNAEGVEIGSPGIYNENPSVLYHPPYGYNAQMPYGPYSPVTTPLPSVRGDGQLYLPPQQFPFTGTYYHQPVPLSMPYITPPSPVPQTDLSMPAGIDQQGAFVADTSNSNSMLFGPRPGYPLPYGSFGRGSFGGSTGSPGYYDLRQGFDGFGSSEPWSDWSKSSDGQQRSFSPLSSQTASPQPIAFGSFGHNVAPLSPANFQTSQQQRPLYGIGSMTSSYNRSYPHSGIYHQGSNFGRGTPGLATNGRSWIAVDKGRRRGRGAGSLCSCNGTLDVLSEQNRGPRASRPKSQQTEHNSSSVDGKKERSIGGDNCEYNRPDFVTEYRDAKFFIIKSYSEDNVHKSIKYGVWASTPNGNRKLDAAYHEAKEQEGPCPVFLLFSGMAYYDYVKVNASAQFCGVAEMMGPVDFDKSVDYWQQDKWSGQFPVKWHIIKDVPNSQFRHIILENNDNKPVTNSRDTQEVKLIKGIEILNIFKDYDSDLSILDDFEYYEGRQKLMQERKARQQASLTNPATASTEHKNPAAVSGEFIKQMSKSFANAVRLDEGKEAPATEKGGAPGKDLTPPTLQSN